MIAYLSGTVVSKQDRTLVLNVQGTGYLVYIPRGILETININEKIELYIHTNVREDDISLYGFRNEEQWKFFKLLLTVSGIGPKSALEILNLPMQHVRQAIAKKDAAALSQIPGIGKKTAQRIIVDLQGKIKEEIMIEGEEVTAAHTQSEDIIQALTSLGYPRNQVVQGLKKIPAKIEEEEAIIKYFLQNI